MPSRRSHTKSHHGCVQCKTRRVKCDETLPECLRCARRQMRCSFRDQTHPSFINNSPRGNGNSQHELSVAPPVLDHILRTHTPASVAEPEPTSTAPSAISVTVPRSFGMLELELIHHYSTQTYITLTSRLTSHIVWRDIMFREAMKCGFLLDALMATSALHKSNLYPEFSEQRAEYARRALSFQNSALSGYIPALSSPTQSNSVALFAISTLLPVWSFGSRRLPEGFGKSVAENSTSLTGQGYRDTTKDMGQDEILDFNSLVSLLQIIQGIDKVVMQTFAWIQKDLTELLRTPTDEDLPPNQPEVTAAFDLLEMSIKEEWNRTSLQSAAAREKQDIYVERLQSLRLVARCRTVLEWDMYIFSWPVTVKPLFIELLKQRDPVALVLFVYWAVCFRSLDHLWWARGWPYKLVKDVSSYLDSSWAKCLEWPRRAFGLEYKHNTFPM